MKKLVILLLMCCALNGIAQNKLNYGIKAGVSFANMYGSISSNSYRKGVTYGAYASYQLNEKSFIQLETNYAQKGFEGKASEIIKMNYWDVPVLYKYRFTDKLSFLAGPQLSFRVKSSYDTNMNYSIDNRVRVIDFGFSVGAEFYVSKNLKSILTYGFGLTPVFKGENAKNCIFSLGLAWDFSSLFGS